MFVSSGQQGDSVIHIHVFVLFQVLFPFRLLWNIGSSSLCNTVGPLHRVQVTWKSRSVLWWEQKHTLKHGEVSFFCICLMAWVCRLSEPGLLQLYFNLEIFQNNSSQLAILTVKATSVAPSTTGNCTVSIHDRWSYLVLVSWKLEIVNRNTIFILVYLLLSCSFWF